MTTTAYATVKRIEQKLELLHKADQLDSREADKLRDEIPWTELTERERMYFNRLTLDLSGSPGDNEAPEVTLYHTGGPIWAPFADVSELVLPRVPEGNVKQTPAFERYDNAMEEAPSKTTEGEIREFRERSLDFWRKLTDEEQYYIWSVCSVVAQVAKNVVSDVPLTAEMIEEAIKIAAEFKTNKITEYEL